MDEASVYEMSSILKEVDDMTDDRASTPPRSFSIVTKQRITIDDPVFLTCDACDLVGNPTHLSSSLFCASQQCSAIDQIRLDSSGTRTAVLSGLSRVSSLHCANSSSSPVLLFTQANNAHVLDTRSACIMTSTSTDEPITSSTVGYPPFQL